MTTNSKTPTESMEELYNKRHKTGDITFVVGSERTKINAHRCVLAALSPKYEAQFFGPNPDCGEIHVPNVSAGAFNEFLQFFYQETVNLSIENIEAVLDLAEQSLVAEFVTDCERFLQSKTTPQNTCWAYGLAIKYNLEAFQSHCEQEIGMNIVQVFASDDFLHCDREMLLNILKMDSLRCTETDVVNACIAWARADCKQKKLDIGKPKNLRTVLGDAIYQIRFTSMQAQEFAALHKSLPDFFTNDEAIELFYIVSELDGFKSEKFNQNPRRKYNRPALRPMARRLVASKRRRMSPSDFEVDYGDFSDH